MSCFGPMLTARGLVCASCREEHMQTMARGYRVIKSITPSEEYL